MFAWVLEPSSSRQKKGEGLKPPREMVQKKIAYLILFVIFIANVLGISSSYAHFPSTPEEECRSIDLRTETNNTLQMPIRDQGKTGWCFANAIADALQLSYQVPEPISAADVAINYSQSDLSQLHSFLKRLFSKKAREKPFETGIAKIAAEMEIQDGYCPEAVFPSDYWTKVTSEGPAKKPTETPVEILDAITQTYGLLQSVHDGTFAQASELPFYFKFKHVNDRDFFDLLKNSTQLKFLIHLREKVCESERVPFPEGNKNFNFKLRTRKIFKAIQTALEAKEPVTVDIFAGVLEDQLNFKKKISDFHTVMVYGSQFNHQAQECQYLIRNSHGTSCEKMDPDLTCEHGYVWLPEHTLFRAMTSALIIKN